MTRLVSGYSHIGPKQKHTQTLRGLENCPEFLLCRFVPQTTLCCQHTAPAGEEKYSANLLWMVKDSLEDSQAGSQKPGAI